MVAEAVLKILCHMAAGYRVTVEALGDDGADGYEITTEARDGRYLKAGGPTMAVAALALVEGLK